MTEPTTAKSNNVFPFNNDTGTTPKRTFSLLKSVNKKKIIPKSESRKFLLYYCLYETICLFNPGCENSFLTSTWSFTKWFMRQNTRKLCRFNESVIFLFSRTLL